jgi:pyruvate ferredoxin oxidoreductase gamma subunit
MYRIRFHGRGGQGMKTASHILGTAFFLEGFEVQDAPRYGAERRGAPIFAYVRAARETINERGIIRRPDLVIVADDSLVPIPAAGVLEGVSAHSVVLIYSNEVAATWKKRLNLVGPVIALPIAAEVEDRLELRYVGAACAGAAARLTGVISQGALEQAIGNELESLGRDVVRKNLDKALEAYGLVAVHEGSVTEAEPVAATTYERPEWISLPFDDAQASAPTIHAAATSMEVRTGLWRTMRPIIDYSRCNRCWWVCSTFCPDGAIRVDEEGYPQIDYDHCKGCMICVAQCPPHAIETVPEHSASAENPGEGKQ